MTKNYELFVADPRHNEIPNLGVAKVGSQLDEGAWSTVEYELQHFVCDGAYESGLERILSSYITSVGGEQPAAWVSGFYGSGKSHLVKVLEHLWANKKLGDGSTPRGLTTTTQPIKDALLELDTVAVRNGGLLAAAGNLLTLPKDINLAFLHILFEAVGLPTDVAAARCILWLTSEGLLNDVMEWVFDESHDWDVVLENMYVSELADAILALRPGWAASPEMAKQQLALQFPPNQELLVGDTIKLAERALARVSDKKGKLPATLVVLDELQQYINDEPARAAAVQGLVEECSNHFGGLVLIVATGQSNLSATPTLQKLIDRFAVRQQLSDADVDKVIREVVLRKRPDRTAELSAILEKNSGEIDRELGGAKIGPVGADKGDLVSDYPLLPARRRLWEAALKGIDPGGRSGQLRTQLKVVHEANLRVAEQEIGTVVPADFLYEQQATGMLQSGALLREVHALIENEQANGSDGPLRSRILALVFLISKLSREGFADTGVRATADHIADLLVDDLATSGSDLRRDVPELLEQLREESKLSRLDDEYQLQSKTGQEWNQEFQQRRKAFITDPARLASERDAALRSVVSAQIPGRLTQGQSKESRPVTVVYGDVPPASGAGVAVWVRNGWDTNEKQFEDTAAAAGTDSPVLFALVPRVLSSEFESALADRAAARETLDARPTPNTDEGREAQKVMQSAADAARAKVDQVVASIVGRVRVRQGGGNPIDGANLTAMIEAGGAKALDRLYPKFAVADNAGWHLAFERAQQGNPDWLGAVGYQGDVADHPVCKEVLAAVTGFGTSGADVRQKLTAPKFGWPNDAVHAALAGLVLQGLLTAQGSGGPSAVGALKAPVIGKTSFRKESQTLSVNDRMQARAVLQALGLPVVPNEELAPAGQVVLRLQELAQATGGGAPLPAPRASDLISELQGRTGNDLVHAVAESSAALISLVKDWKSLASKASPRREQFAKVERLVAQLGVEGEPLREQLQAVRENRALLDEPDPVPPVEQSAGEQLRQAVQERAARYSSALEQVLLQLDADASWQKLSGAQKQQLLATHKLGAVQAPPMGSTDELLKALESRSLVAWDDLIDALSSRAQAARAAAAQLAIPTAQKVALPPATLTSASEIDAYLAEAREKLLAAVEQYSSVWV